MCLCNDIWSCLRENFVLPDNDMNYISLVRERNNASIEKAVQVLTDLIEEAYEQIKSCKQKIIESDLNVGAVYVNAVLDTIYGNLAWSKVCDRYNMF